MGRTSIHPVRVSKVRKTAKNKLQREGAARSNVPENTPDLNDNKDAETNISQEKNLKFDENDVINEPKKWKPEQQIFVMKAFNNVLFEAQLSTLNKYSVVINGSRFADPLFPTSSEITNTDDDISIYLRSKYNCD